MKLLVVDERKELLREPYVVRLGGWTLDRYLAEAPESQRWEYVRGEVVMYSPATAEHQDLVRFLLRLLDGYCEERSGTRSLPGLRRYASFPMWSGNRISSPSFRRKYRRPRVFPWRCVPPW